MANTLAEQYLQTTGSLEPFTRATYDPYSPTPAVGAGISVPPVPQVPVADAYAQAVPGQRQPRQPAAPSVWYDPAAKKFNINGYIVDDDDDSAIATADQMLAGEFGGAAPTQGMMPVDPGSFQQLVGRIRNPGKWKLFKKNVGIGVDQLQQLGGYALQAAGVEDIGKSIVEQQEKDLSKTSVYNRNFTDIQNGGDVVDWFIANLGQQVPNLVMSAATSGVGGVIGGTTRGALVSTLGKAGLQMAGKKGLSNTVLNAARKYAAGATLSVAEKKALTGAATAAARNAALESSAKAALAAGVNQARVGGAMLGGFAGNYAMGVGDVYGETVEAGDPSRLKAFGYAVPYALAETAPEVLGAAAVFRPGKAAKAVTAGAKAAGKSPASMPARLLRNVGEKGGRLLRGAGAGALAEGSTEAFQEGLLVAANPNLSLTDMTQETKDRLINSFAGGAAIGGLFGGAGNMLRRRRLQSGEPTALLETNKPQLTYNRGGETDLLGRPAPVDPDLSGLQAEYGMVSPEETVPITPRQTPVEDAYGRTPAGSYVEGVIPRNSAMSVVNPDILAQQEAQRRRADLAAVQGQLNVLQQQVADQRNRAYQRERAAEFGTQPTGTQGNLFDAYTPVAPTRQMELFQNMPQTQQTPVVPASPVPTAPPVTVVNNFTDIPAFTTQQSQTSTAVHPRVEAIASAIDTAISEEDPVKAKAAFQKANRLYSALSLQDEETAKSLERLFPPDVRKVEDKIENARALLGAQTTPVPQQTTVVREQADATTLGNLLTDIANMPGGQERAAVISKAEALLKDMTGDESVTVNGVTVPLKDVLSKSGKSIVTNKLPKGEATQAASATEPAVQKAQSVQEASSTKRPTEAAVDKLFSEGHNVSRGTAQNVVSMLTSDSLNAKTRNRLADKIIKQYWETDDSVQRGNIQQAIFESVPPKARLEYRGNLTPLGRVLESMNLLDSVETAEGGRAPVVVSRDVMLASQVGTIEEAGNTPNAWDNIEELVSDEAIPAEVLDNFEDDVSNKKISPEELSFIESKLGVGRLLNADGSFNTDAADKLFANYEGPKLSRPEGMWLRTDGTTVGKGFSVGKTTLAAKSFMAKLAKAPNTHVFSNIDDLKSRNPKLYAAAKAARADGKFDVTDAMGYSFGDNVILFSDNIHTTEQLKNVLAHEAIGHYGLRSIMDRPSFDRMLKDVYNSSEQARQEIKQLQDAYSIDRNEATEEYLATKAAELDQSLLKRIWAAVKKFLNKLGCTFDDDMVLSVLSQARKYIREGRLDANSKSLGAKVSTAPGRFMSAGSFVDSMTGGNKDSVNSSLSDALQFEKTLPLNDRLTTQGISARIREFLSNPDTRGSRVRTLVEGAKNAAGMFRTLNSLALDCVGVDKLYRIFQNRTQAANTMLSRLEQMRKETSKTATSTKDKGIASALLAFGSLHLTSGNLDERIAKLPPLIEEDADGNRRLVSKEKQEAYLRYGILTPEEFSNGISYTDSLGKEHIFRQNVKATDQAYKVYVENRRAINQAALFDAQGDLAMALGATENYNKAFEEIFARYTDTPENRKLIDTAKKVADVYMKMREDAVSFKEGEIKSDTTLIRNAEALLQQFIEATHDSKKAEEWATRKMLDTKKPKEGGIPRVLLEREDLLFMQDAAKSFDKATIKTNSMNAFRRALHNRALSSMQAVNAERRTKETIARGYVPFRRRGDKQLVLAAYDEHGNRVILNEAFSGVVPRYHGSRVELESIQSELNNLFPADRYVTVTDNTGNDVKVRFTPELSDVETTAALASQITVRDFVSMLETLNINLDALETERMVRALADAANSAMNRLHRAGNPGFDPDMIRNAAEYMASCAHSSAAKAYQYEMSTLFTDNRNWYGDKQLLNRLADAVKNAKTDDERRTAQRNYDGYARKYMHMAPESRDNYVMLGSKMRKCLGQGNLYKEKAKELMRWSQSTSNIISNNNDILNSDIGSKFKAAIVMGHLGMSVAGAAINMTSIVTNSLPYFAYYNKNNGFGLGHGFGKSLATLSSTVYNVKDPRLGDLSYLEKIQSDGTYKSYGLSEDEIKFLVDQTKSGVLQAAQYNHLMGEARGKIQNNYAAAGVKAWMWMFSYTEELNRRATALAAFRLERGRGVDYKTAVDTATIAVDTTQGNYNQFNRPSIGRHNLGQYMYMYKQFVVTSLQLLKDMDYRGKLTYLGCLFLLSGFKGIPFADDAMDIIDTLCQAFGLKVGSVEEEVIKMVDDIAPGMAPYFMRGIIDKNTGMTVSTRTGMGDLLPLTGVFKAGADPWREAENFVGPVLSGMTGTVGMAMSLGRMGLEAAGVREGNTTFNQILRESPVAAMRILGDAAAYASDGSVTNMTGAVISKRVTPMVIAQRLLGFYPADATLQNDVVRLTKQKDEYIKEIKAGFVGSYVRAAIGKDRAAMNRLVKDVNAWNAAAKRVAPDMQIQDFHKSAMQALKAAQMPTGARHLKVVSKGLRASEEQLLGMYGYAPGDLDY